MMFLLWPYLISALGTSYKSSFGVAALRISGQLIQQLLREAQLILEHVMARAKVNVIENQNPQHSYHLNSLVVRV